MNTLLESPIAAADGETGRVRDFLFDDQSWQVRYVVVDLGNWLRRRDVVVPVSALDHPDWKGKRCRTCLTVAALRNCPDVDTRKPVSRQQELAMREYFGPIASWADARFALTTIPAFVQYSPEEGEDSHLRSSCRLMGHLVWATDGNLGRLRGFLMDEGSWHVSELEVGATDWQDLRIKLVPTKWVDRVSWAECRVYLHHASVAV
ncbi:MAG TPA: PRC-barrel domain-containing protein [Terracidiphilus sp.]|nr:PRC-barrel domain-containing protein [Terracidiphilus sp.]